MRKQLNQKTTKSINLLAKSKVKRATQVHGSQVQEAVDTTHYKTWKSISE